MAGKKKVADLPKYIEPQDIPEAKWDAVVGVLEMLARQSGVGEIRDKVEELKTLKG